MVFTIALFSSILLSSVSCNIDLHNVYDSFLNEVVDVKQLEKTIRNILPKEDEDPILLFIDSRTKIPSGVMGGNFFDFGHFDECYGIHVEDIYGKYCLGTLKYSPSTQKYFEIFNLNSTKLRPNLQVHPEPRLFQLGAELTGFHWAICVPHTIAAEDIPGLLTYTKSFCYSKATEPALSNGAIATIVVLVVFLAIALVSTAFDAYLYYSEKTAPHELFIAFSFLTNGRKIFKSTSNPDQLLCLNGIRAISMMWVLLGHEYSNAFNAPIYNLLDFGRIKKDAKNMWIMGATLSVDSFFVVGGLLIVYTFLKSMNKGVKFNVVLFYIHRYLRLTPALVVTGLVYLYLLKYLGNGPLWMIVDYTLAESCRRGWWSTLLYITNYVQDGVCVPQAWYLSVDMQLYILSPIILIPLYKWPKKALGALGVLAVIGCVVPFAIGYSEDIGTMFTLGADSQKYFNDYYSQTHTRFGPYVIGMILGYFVYEVKHHHKLRMSKLAACFWWLVCLTGLVACLYAEFPLIDSKEEDKWGNSMFLALDRPGWAVFLSGVIFLCVSGYGHPVNKFLSLPVFQFLTKISYSMYLIHFAVIIIRYAAMKNTIRFSHAAIMHVYWADFMVTLGLSLILCLVFESPIIILEKYLFGRGSTKRERKSKNKVEPEV